jgi:hypothetical protein
MAAGFQRTFPVREAFRGSSWRYEGAGAMPAPSCLFQSENQAGALGIMNWTSTQHSGWAEQCREFASKRTPFRLDHVAGQKEEETCVNFCAEHHFRRERRGSSVLFTPIPS